MALVIMRDGHRGAVRGIPTHENRNGRLEVCIDAAVRAPSDAEERRHVRSEARPAENVFTAARVTDTVSPVLWTQLTEDFLAKQRITSASELAHFFPTPRVGTRMSRKPMSCGSLPRWIPAPSS